MPLRDKQGSLSIIIDGRKMLSIESLWFERVDLLARTIGLRAIWLLFFIISDKLS